MSGFAIAIRTELGLAADKISVTPRWKNEDIHVDDFGPFIPPEVLWMLADVNIRMRLIHYDQAALQICLAESMGGSVFGFFAPGRPAPAINQGPIDGLMAGAGSLLGNNCAPLASGCHYISLNLLSPVLGVPWRFPTAYLDAQPVVIPLGTEASIVDLSWRAIPYQYHRQLTTLSATSGGSLYTPPPFQRSGARGAGSGVAGGGGGGINNNPAPRVSSGTQYSEIQSSGAVLWDHQNDSPF
jgi:hypothetical protein